MSKTYRVTSEVVNFSLVEPDTATFSDAVEDARSSFLQIREAIQQPCRVTVTLADEEDEDEEDATTMLGRLCAEYYRNL